MASKKARKRSTRRDRRKAKQSGWMRPGKSNPTKVGHGGSGMMTSKRQMNRKANRDHQDQVCKTQVRDDDMWLTMGDYFATDGHR